MSVTGTVYLLHFDRPVGNTNSKTGYALHYIGWASNLRDRLAAHRAGRSGVRLMEVVWQAGITWSLARTWPGTRARERAIKRQGGAKRCCPLCGIRPRSAGMAAVIPAPAAPARVPFPLPPRIPAYERGAAKALALVGGYIAAGWPASRIETAQAAMFRDYDESCARPDAREWHRGYQETAAALIEAHRDESVSLAELEGASA